MTLLSSKTEEKAMDWINLTQDKDKWAVVTLLDWLKNY